MTNSFPVADPLCQTASVDSDILPDAPLCATAFWDRTRCVVPVHPVESLALGPTDPRMNSGLTDAEFVGDLVLRLTAPDGGDDDSAASGFPIPLLMATSNEGYGFQSRLRRTDRDVVAEN